MVKGSRIESTKRKVEPTDFFRGRKVLIATRHGKEKVIAPVLVELGMVPIQLSDFDTDQFGTFTGEVERQQDALATARLKIKEALRISGETLGIASEGSFGAHPQIGLIPADEEWLILIDTFNELEIFASHLSTHTNYSQQEVSSWGEVKMFADQIGFPVHAVILRSATSIQKGITTWEVLQKNSEELLLTGAISIETDMRAMFNPTRMEVIAKTAKLLAEKINAICPACHFPGFGVTQRIAGLPCHLCNRPTSLTLKLVKTCQHCSNQSEVLSPEGESCDPMYCNYCNP